MYAEVKPEATIIVAVWSNRRLQRNYETQIVGWDIEDWMREAWNEGEFGHYSRADAVQVVVTDVMGVQYVHTYEPPEP